MALHRLFEKIVIRENLSRRYIGKRFYFKSKVMDENLLTIEQFLDRFKECKNKYLKN